MHRATLFGLSSLLLAAVSAEGASYNIDFGDGTVPESSYGAAGAAGVWNAVAVLPSSQRQDLLDLDGVASGARIYMVGADELLFADDPGTAGDDAALLDDMLIGFNDPLDVCIWIEGLDPGEYEVLTYALTPADPDLLSRVRVDDGDPGPVFVGGAWPGTHEAGVSYACHLVTVASNGTIGLHSGEISAEVQSGINGIQVRPAVPTSLGELDPAPVQGRVWPNPARARQEIRFDRLVPGSRVVVEILDVGGRRLLVWPTAAAWDGSASLVWEGWRADGAAVPPGVYFARVAGGPATRIVRIR